MCHHPTVKSAAHCSNVIRLIIDAYVIALTRRAMVTGDRVLMVCFWRLRRLRDDAIPAAGQKDRPGSI
jgi:hypothetical protein